MATLQTEPEGDETLVFFVNGKKVSYGDMLQLLQNITRYFLFP